MSVESSVGHEEISKGSGPVLPHLDNGEDSREAYYMAGAPVCLG